MNKQLILFSLWILFTSVGCTKSADITPKNNKEKEQKTSKHLEQMSLQIFKKYEQEVDEGLIMFRRVDSTNKKADSIKEVAMSFYGTARDEAMEDANKKYAQANEEFEIAKKHMKKIHKKIFRECKEAGIDKKIVEQSLKIWLENKAKSKKDKK